VVSCAIIACNYACSYFRICVWCHLKNVCWRRITVIISLVAFSCNLTLTVSTITRYVTSTSTQVLCDSTKRCHWLQHFCLMNIFEHVWRPAIIECRNGSALHAIIAQWNHGIRLGPHNTLFCSRPVNTACEHGCSKSHPCLQAGIDGRCWRTRPWIRVRLVRIEPNAGIKDKQR